MNKIVGFGVAIALCMAAAGFGAYLALRPQTAPIPAAAAGEAGSPSAQVVAGSGGLTNSAEATAPGSTQAPGTVAAPATDAVRTQPAAQPKATPSTAPVSGV